jgi:hypothetical protein
MKLTRALTLIVCASALSGLWACQQDATSTPTSPASPSLSVSNEVRGNGYGIGGVKVDSSGCGTCGTDYEDNTLQPYSTAIVWIANGPTDWCGNYYYTVTDKNFVFVGSTSLGDYDYSCEAGKLRGYEIPVPGGTVYGGSNSATLTVWCDGKSIGSDSFRMIYNDSCEK